MSYTVLNEDGTVTSSAKQPTVQYAPESVCGKAESAALSQESQPQAATTGENLDGTV